MNTFAKLWPNTLSEAEPLRDLGYAPSVGFRELVFKVGAGDGPWHGGYPPVGRGSRDDAQEASRPGYEAMISFGCGFLDL
eukprot:Skav211303  [mRNA]  locus=scaffold1052:279040:279279:- [translate_table: standard]